MVSVSVIGPMRKIPGGWGQIDADVVACSPASVYRVLSKAGLLRRHTNRSLKGTGFVQPLAPHAHWHLDIAYLNIRGTFYFIASVLDGYSRMVVHWDTRFGPRRFVVALQILSTTGELSNYLPLASTLLVPDRRVHAGPPNCSEPTWLSRLRRLGQATNLHIPS